MVCLFIAAILYSWKKNLWKIFENPARAFSCLLQVLLCPLSASHTAGSSERSSHDCSHLVETVSIWAKSSSLFLTDATQAREGPSRETSPREAPASGWAALGLSYKVQWPLHILFTPAVLEKWVSLSFSQVMFIQLSSTEESIRSRTGGSKRASRQINSLWIRGCELWCLQGLETTLISKAVHETTVNAAVTGRVKPFKPFFFFYLKKKYHFICTLKKLYIETYNTVV